MRIRSQRSTHSTRLRGTEATNRTLVAADALERSGFAILLAGAGECEEAALVARADTITAEQVTFLVRHTSGLICVALTDRRAAALNLPELADPRYTAGAHRYAVSVDAHEGITTGISSADRARTISLLAHPRTHRDDLSRPGHVITVRVADRDIGQPVSHAEAALALLGINPEPARANPYTHMPNADACAVYAVLTSVRHPTATAAAIEATEFARTYGLPFVTAADIATTAAKRHHHHVTQRHAKSALAC